MNKFFLVILTYLIVLSGCSNVRHVADVETANVEETGEIYVYRPMSDWKAPAISFRAFADGAFIGEVPHGGFLAKKLAAGKHEVTVRPYFLGIPDGKEAKLQIELSSLGKIYLRYSQQLDQFLPVGGGVAVVGKTMLQQVDESMWLGKR